MGFLRLFSPLTIVAGGLFLGGCDIGGKHGGRPSDAAEPIGIRTPRVERCDRRIGDYTAFARVVNGVPGDAATVEMLCGDRSIGSCTPACPPGGPRRAATCPA
jgi:hypothetical protein